MNNITRIATITGLVLALALAACGQQATMMDVLAGKAAPLSVKLKELDGTWHSFSINSQGDASSTLMMLMMMSRGPGGQQPSTPVYYTKGQVVTLGGEKFLVAYSRPAPPPMHLLAGMRGNGDEAMKQANVTPDTEMTLSLLNLRNTGNLLNIRPFNLQAELDGNAKADKAGVKAEQEQSLKNLRQLAVSVLMYAQDNDEQLPDNLATLRTAIGNLDKDILIQPVTGKPYQYNMALSGLSLGDVEDPSKTVLAFEATPWPDGTRIVAYVDGHVELVNAEAWTRLEAAMKRKR